MDKNIAHTLFDQTHSLGNSNVDVVKSLLSRARKGMKKQIDAFSKIVKQHMESYNKTDVQNIQCTAVRRVISTYANWNYTIGNKIGIKTVLKAT